MVFCSLIASSAIRAFISALKLRRCLDFISAPFPRQRFYTLLTGPNFGEHFTRGFEGVNFLPNVGVPMARVLRQTLHPRGTVELGKSVQDQLLHVAAKWLCEFLCVFRSR